MKVLVVTEKCSANGTENDGGARLVHSLKNVFGPLVHIMQFGSEADSSATWHFPYPNSSDNRFERRVANGPFIADRVVNVADSYTHILFIHLSMQFGFADRHLCKRICSWTFPMFLTPSYETSGEKVPEDYFQAECRTLSKVQNILTPSYLEKRQLMDIYSVPREKIHVIPRGVDRRMISPKVRVLESHPCFCSIGSIKPQKNTVGLVRLFAKILKGYPGARLKMIGPVQNRGYFETVCAEINKLGLREKIEMTGHIPPFQLSKHLEEAHLHLSGSLCETFGRSIFESLASGLPNIARFSGNAAAEYLKGLPYAVFTDRDEEALQALDRILHNLSKHSEMAIEVGQLFDDEVLSRLIAAKITGQKTLAVSDFDGTLFHKDCPVRTRECMDAFKQFPIRILCSARSIDDLLEQIDKFGMTVDWIIGLSGSCVADGKGRRLWHTPLAQKDYLYLEGILPDFQRIESEGELLQLAVPAALTPHLPGYRIEIYQGIAYISHWNASKFRAVHRLLHHIQWSGSVAAFGDGPYDEELLTYYDGTRISLNAVFPKSEKTKRGSE